jgi:hypothetical protein
MASEELKKFLEEFSDRIDAKLDTQQQAFATIVSESLAGALAPLADKVNVLEFKVTAIEKKVDEVSDIASRVNNLQLNGLPYKAGENLQILFNNLSALLGYEEPPEARFHRFNGDDNNNRPVMLTFSTEYHKLQFLTKFKLIAKDIVRSKFPGFPNDNGRLYLQHDFTNTQYKLNKAAIALIREKEVQKIRIGTGTKIMIQIGPDDKFAYFPTADALREEIERRKKRAAKK